MDKLKIDPEFKSLIPPLSSSERDQLEKNILREGCRDPLVIWGKTVIDGHNRYAICTANRVDFKTVPVEFDDRDAARNWIVCNQLGRRNLTPEQFRYFLGKRYGAEKKAHGGTGANQYKQIDQNEPSATADRIAAETGTSAATVKRSEPFAQSIDADPELKAALMETGTVKSAIREKKRAEVVSRLESVAAVEAKTAQGLYDVIVIDPPWPMQKIDRDERPNQVAFDYPAMTEAEIQSFNLPAADDCHVWLWTTHKHLPMAFRIATGWGLKYVCMFIWHKPGGFQPFGLPQYNSEFALYCRKGSPQFIDTKAFPVCFNAPRGKHSEKPSDFYNMIRRVTAGRRIDIFNRRDIDGFDGIGKEAPNVLAK